MPANAEPVVDTIGAGDAFCGALASYLASGLDMVEAGNLACGFASMSVRRRGANYPDVGELPDMLRPAAIVGAKQVSHSLDLGQTLLDLVVTNSDFGNRLAVNRS